jgi:16S rRNA (uracil1498-N3)-methyltransferase
VRSLRIPASLDPAALAAGALVLAGPAAHYALRVRRVAPGDALVLFDPERGLEVDAEVREAGRDQAVLSLGAARPATVVSRRRVTLIQSVGKGDKLDAVVRDATELGATAIAPAIAARSVARREGPAVLERLRRIAVEAARQCGRGDVPRVDEARPLADVAASIEDDLRVALIPDAPRGLGPLLAATPPGASVALAVGPEGGFAPEDRAALAAARFVEASLGPMVLRTETVCAAVLGALLILGQPPDPAFDPGADVPRA